jgi:hypothetical protein
MMPDLRTELKQGSAYKQVHGVIAHAMKVHNEREGCTFDRTADEIADEVFEFLVSKVEGAEKDCHTSLAGFTDGEDHAQQSPTL